MSFTFRFLHLPCSFYATGQNSILLAASISIFITLFFLTYQPFEFRDFFTGKKIYVALIIGGTTFISIVFNALLFDRYIKYKWRIEEWTISRELIWGFWNLICIGMACYFVLLPFMPVPSGLCTFIGIQKCTMVVGILPLIGVVGFKRFIYYHQHLEQSRQFNSTFKEENSAKETDRFISIYSENNKEQFIFQVNQLLYINSSGNYIELHYLENHNPVKKLIRNKISGMEKYFQDFWFIARCHRTCIINLNQVVSIDRNSQGCTLLLKNVDHPIKVSRTYADQIDRLMA